MPLSPRDFSPHRQSSFSVLDTASFSPKQINDLFETADSFALHERETGRFPTTNSHRKVIACLFFEPSTRTRLSFQMAAERLGYGVLTLESAATSSVSKGETLEDTVLNVLAMKPDALVVRYGQDAALDTLLPTLAIPVLNAGSGTTAHPTQALLDAYTMTKELGSLENKRVLIVGDVRHSRVASSNFDVLKKLGATIALCGPKALLPEKAPGEITMFENLDEATAWCDVYMALRVQLERHSGAGKATATDLTTYHREFGLNSSRLQILKKDAIVLHPGPINHGVEFSADVMSDSRTRVLQQVSNGVLIRAVLLARALETPEVGRV